MAKITQYPARLFPLFALFIALVANMQMVGVAEAAFNIPDGDVAGLIAAINAANASPGADTINLASHGMYTLTDVYDSNAAGTGPVGLPAIDTDITINGRNAIIERDDGSPDFRFFTAFDTTSNLTVKNLTLRNGRLTGDVQFGGAMIFAGGKGKLINTTITQNQAQDAGGLMNLGSDVTIINSQIVNNSNTNCCGSGLFNSGLMTITNSVVSGNTGRGAGIYNSGDMTLTNVTIADNSMFPDTGGGVVNGGTIRMTNVTFRNNFGANGAGGFHNAWGSATLTNIAFIENYTGDGGVGGAIYNNAQLDAVNIYFFANRADFGAAAAIYNNGDGVMSVRNGTFIHNGSEGSGDIIVNYGSLTITHSTIDGQPIG